MSLLLLTYDLHAAPTESLKQARLAFRGSLRRSGWFNKIQVNNVIRPLPNTTYATRSSRAEALRDVQLAISAGQDKDEGFAVKRWIIVDGDHVGSYAVDDAPQTSVGIALSLPI